MPIVSGVPERRHDRERFGSLFYLGIGGLALVLALLGWFAWGVWSLRTVWGNVYVLHDEHRSESERVRAAFAFAHDPRVNQRQLWDITLRKSLPPLARYVVAEALTAEAAAADPSGYAVAVARSEGWPVWLRLLLTRPLAYRAALDLPVPRKPVVALSKNSDRATALWATYALAEGAHGDPGAAESIRQAARAGGPDEPLARHLLAALEATRLEPRLTALDEATLWLRHHHPAAAPLWDGWRVQGDRLLPPR